MKNELPKRKYNPVELQRNAKNVCTRWQRFGACQLNFPVKGLAKQTNKNNNNKLCSTLYTNAPEKRL